MNTSNTARQTTVTHITIARRWRAMDYLITASLVRQGYSDTVIRIATKTARELHAHGHTASRSMRMAVMMVERLQVPNNPNNTGPQAA